MSIRNKYNAKKASRVVGKETYTFDSKAEAKHFDKLYLLLKAGTITELKLQPKYKLTESYTLKCNFTKNKKTTVSAMTYTPDFSYKRAGMHIVDEVKGKVTVDYRMRLKLFLAIAKDKYQIDEFNEIIGSSEKSYHL